MSAKSGNSPTILFIHLLLCIIFIHIDPKYLLSQMTDREEPPGGGGKKGGVRGSVRPHAHLFPEALTLQAEQLRSELINLEQTKPDLY